MHAGTLAVPTGLSIYVCCLLSLHLVSVKKLDLFYFAHEGLAVDVVVGVPVFQVFPIGHHRDGFAGGTVHLRLLGGR